MRLDHASSNYLKKICPELKNIKFEESIKGCETCKLSKMVTQPCSEIRTKAQHPMQRINSDIMGPMKPILFPGRFKYIISFIRHLSRYAKVYCLKNKSKAGKRFKKIYKMQEK